MYTKDIPIVLKIIAYMKRRKIPISKKMIAEGIGVNTTVVRNHVQHLERAGLIKTDEKNPREYYHTFTDDWSGL